jgi:hypothetical protein
MRGEMKEAGKLLEVNPYRFYAVCDHPERSSQRDLRRATALARKPGRCLAEAPTKQQQLSLFK